MPAPAWSTRRALRGEVLAQRLVQAHVAEHAAFLQLRLALPAPRGLAVMGNAQFDIGPRQRQRAQPVLDMRQLGAFGAQELAPRRHVVEQVAHFHRGAGRMRVRHDLADLAALDLQQRAVFVAGGATSTEATDRGDRGQRLAAEAQCRTASRSSSEAILLVAWRCTASGNSAGRCRRHRRGSGSGGCRLPPGRCRCGARRHPARSRPAPSPRRQGRSTTSPAAIWLMRVSGSWRMVTPGF
jgi:hypothetical protein